MTIKRKQLWQLIIGGLLLLALAGTIWFIFSNSMQPARVSSNSSQRVLRTLQELLRRLGHPGASASLTEHAVRKAAHFCEYSLEGFLLLLTTRAVTGHAWRFISWPALAGLLTALTDETIQLFSGGRSSQVTDIWIDFGGVVTGMALALALLWLIGLLLGRRRPASRHG